MLQLQYKFNNIMAIVYTNTGDFLTTLSLWQDQNLTIKAADGWYQSGGMYREMRNGELLRPVVCDECVITTPCGQQTAFSGQQSYPDTQAFNLGSDTGEVTVTYNAFSVPDRFIVKLDNVIVSDTGYVGSSDFDFGGSSRNSFTSSLTGKLDPVTGTVYPDTLNFPEDGFPRILGPGSGTTSFNKELPSPSLAFVDVYGPMSGTAWNVILSCPVAVAQFNYDVFNSVSKVDSSEQVESNIKIVKSPDPEIVNNTTATSSTATGQAEGGVYQISCFAIGSSGVITNGTALIILSIIGGVNDANNPFTEISTTGSLVTNYDFLAGEGYSIDVEVQKDPDPVN